MRRSDTEIRRGGRQCGTRSDGGVSTELRDVRVSAAGRTGVNGQRVWSHRAPALNRPSEFCGSDVAGIARFGEIDDRSGFDAAARKSQCELVCVGGDRYTGIELAAAHSSRSRIASAVGWSVPAANRS